MSSAEPGLRSRSWRFRGGNRWGFPALSDAIPSSPLPLLVPLLLLLTGVSAVAQSHLPARWRWSNPAPFGGNVFDLTYGLGLTVAVTERGQIFTSDDLALWDPRESGTTNALRAVTFFGERLVVTGERGTVLYADSLDAFQRLSLGTSDWLEAVVASTNLLVAVGDNGAVYTSREGVAWARQNAGTTLWLDGVAWGQGTYVLVGEQGFIATSSNGTNWTKRTSNTTRNLKRVAWINTQFCAVGDGGLILTSATGSSAWTSSNSGATNTLFDAEAAPLDEVVVGDNEVRLRRNNAPWSNALSSGNDFAPPPWTYYNAQWEGSLFLLSGRSGMLVEGFQTNATSPYVWVERDQSIRNWLWELQRLPDFYVTAGFRGTVMTSVNGIDWDLELVPDAATNTTFFGVGGTTNLLLAVGENGRIIASPNTFVPIVSTNAGGGVVTNEVSTLGIIWNATASPTTNALQGIAVLQDQFVLTGDNGTILTGTDTAQWTSRTSGTTNFLTGIAAFPGGLVAVGRNGTILASADAVTWTPHSQATTNWIFRVRYLGGQLIAVGQNGMIFTSPDGAAWTRRTSGLTTRWLTDVTLLDDTYFAVGTLGAVLASTNAIDWKYLGTITEKSLYGVACHEGQLVAAGVEGAIVRSQVVPDLSPVSFVSFSQRTNATALLLAGHPDQRFTLDRASSFTNWTTGPVFEFLDSSGTLLLLETPDSNQPAMFFRATTVP